MSMKRLPSFRFLVGLVATVAMVACASPSGGQDHVQHHAGQSTNSTASGSSGASPEQGGMTGGGTAAGSGGMQPMHKETMCAMYRAMRDAPNEQARQAMMDRNMREMSPEMREHYLEMMPQQCP